jgi:hypothetical protein
MYVIVVLVVLFSPFTHTKCMLLLFLGVQFSPFTRTTCMLLLFLVVLFNPFTHTTCMLLLFWWSCLAPLLTPHTCYCCFWWSCLAPLVFLLHNLQNYLSFQYFDFEATRWRYCWNISMRTKLNIYIFIIVVYLVNCLNPMLTGGRVWSLPI